MTDFVKTKFVKTKFVKTKFVKTKFVKTKFVKTKFVKTKFDCIFYFISCLTNMQMFCSTSDAVMPGPLSTKVRLFNKGSIITKIDDVSLDPWMTR